MQVLFVLRVLGGPYNDQQQHLCKVVFSRKPKPQNLLTEIKNGIMDAWTQFADSMLLVGIVGISETFTPIAEEDVSAYGIYMNEREHRYDCNIEAETPNKEAVFPDDKDW